LTLENASTEFILSAAKKPFMVSLLFYIDFTIAVFCILHSATKLELKGECKNEENTRLAEFTWLV